MTPQWSTNNDLDGSVAIGAKEKPAISRMRKNRRLTSIR
jgi:hypothetical protein